MPAKNCTEQADAAYDRFVGKLLDVYFDCMLTADTPEAEKDCAERFKKGLKRAKRARAKARAACEELEDE